MINYSSPMAAMKEAVMSGKLTDKQQNRMVNTMCAFAILIGIAAVGVPIAIIVKAFA